MKIPNINWKIRGFTILRTGGEITGLRYLPFLIVEWLRKSI